MPVFPTTISLAGLGLRAAAAAAATTAAANAWARRPVVPDGAARRNKRPAKTEKGTRKGALPRRSGGTSGPFVAFYAAFFRHAQSDAGLNAPEQLLAGVCTAGVQAPCGMPFDSLGAFVDALRRRGELVEISAEVDRYLEMSEIADRV